MGDAIMSLPFVRAALEGYDVYVTCTPATAPVFEMVLPADRIIPWTPPWLADEGRYDKKRWAESGVKEYTRKLKQLRPQVAVSVWADTRVHWLMAMSGAKKRVGFPMVKQNYYANHLAWRQRQLRLGKVLYYAGSLAMFRPLLNVSLERRNEQQHHVVCWQQIAQALLLPWSDAAPWLTPPTATFPDEVQKAFDEARANGQPIWMVHAGARVEAHRWPVENFDRVLREELQAAGAKVILLESPEVAWPGTLKHTFPSCRTKDIPSLFAAMAQADALLCNDTGVAHVAAALGKPVVAVFTASNPDWFAPWGSRPRAVRRQVCEFHPCFGHCQQPNFICRDGVTVEMVSKSVRQLQGELAAK